MGIYYNPQNKTSNKWTVSYEKTDYTDEELNDQRPLDAQKKEYYPVTVCKRWFLGMCVEEGQEMHHRFVSDPVANAIRYELNKEGRQNKIQLQINLFKNQAYDKVLAISSATQGGDYVKQREILRSFLNSNDSLLPTNLPTGSAVYTPRSTDNYIEVDVPYDSENPPYARDSEGNIIYDWDGENARPRIQPNRMRVPDDDLNSQNAQYNAYYEAISQANARANIDNEKINQQKLLANPILSLQTALEEQYKNFYRNEKLQVWNTNLGAKPLYGDFDPKYYKETYPQASAEWNAAVANDDIDITERYGENGYYLQHYTNQGKPAGYRGNAPELAEQSRAYVETKPTDRDIQAVRDLQLGVDTDTQTQRLLNIPEIAAEWEKAKQNDPYWDKLAKEKYLNVNKPDEFAALFRLSERPEDKQVSLSYNINTGYGVTELEDALNQAVGEQATVDVKRFGALAQDVLKETINEMKQAKAKEEMLGLLGGFGGFSEIMNINNELSNAILGDTGVGGLLSFTSAGKAEESLEKSLQKISGVGNNTTYNWQQWFDSELKKRYQQDLELGYTTEEAQEQVNIQGEFARKFIDEYLTPRFNTARSMDEFVEYIDIRQEEQNPFQTQDMVNAVSLVADLRAQQYLDQIKTIGDRYFDSEFYFNPVGNKAREAGYAAQAETVAKDWEAAKNGDPYWAQQAYRFGIDVNDKDAFARIHFQVKGQGQGYDAAKDILTAGSVQDEIYNNILPALKEEALKQGSVFGQFITPEEFADEMLRGLDPNDKSTWEEVLQRYGLTDFKGTVDELKQYVIETLRTGSAQEIREEIKYLNEKRQKPTQQLLGLTYIERPEDYKDEMAKPQTELYKVFQGAGYQGTEDEFYQNFFPDLDRSEQTILTKAGSDQALKTYGLDLGDPFASLGTIESFLDEGDTKTDTTTDKSSSFFRLGLGEDEEEPEYKTKTGTQILGEFTSMFKGL